MKQNGGPQIGACFILFEQLANCKLAMKRTRLRNELENPDVHKVSVQDVGVDPTPTPQNKWSKTAQDLNKSNRDCQGMIRIIS